LKVRAAVAVPPPDWCLPSLRSAACR
jgi:hypothetical protein